MKIEDYFIIVNPISGNGKSEKLLKSLIDNFENKSITHKIIITEYSGHAKKICKNLKEYEKVIIIGGDGTFNEAINGLMINDHKPIIGFIPGGTGNAMMHDLKGTTYDKALDIILSNRTKKIDAMQLDFNESIEYSINIVGWGMAADINILSEKLRFLGPTRYTIASMYYVFNKVCRKAKIEIDEREIVDNFLFILTLNTIHTGKGMKAAPKARLDDGLMDIIILKSNISKLELLLLLPKIFSGKHVLSDKVEYVQGKKINIIPEENEILNIDGEMRCSTPINISILPHRLEIFSEN